MNVRHAFVLAAGVCLAQWAQAQVAVTQPWVRATAPGQTTAAAYMELKSTEQAALVSAASPVSKMAEVHETRIESGVAKMRPVARLSLPAGKTVELKPGGYHIMIMDIAKPLKAGDTVLIVLMVETVDKKHHHVEVRAQVRDSGPASTHQMDMK